MSSELTEINQLKGIIYNSILKGVKGESTRKNDEGIVIHASSVISLCPRYIHYIMRDKSLIPENKNTIMKGTSVTFGIGIAVEDFVVKNLGRYGENKIWWQYRCPRCGYTDVRVGRKVPYKCDTCGIPMTKNQVEIEHTIKEDIVIKGNPDLLLHNKALGDKFYVVELKTISGKEFDTLTTPLISHINQVKTYLWLIRNLPMQTRGDFKLTSRYGFIVYVSKEHKKDPLKIFRIRLDKKWKENLDKDIEAIKGDKLPPRICSTKNSLMAKECPAVKVCFRGV